MRQRAHRVSAPPQSGQSEAPTPRKRSTRRWPCCPCRRRASGTRHRAGAARPQGCTPSEGTRAKQLPQMGAGLK
eukprot:2010361-Prymnesium_polylepis.1